MFKKIFLGIIIFLVLLMGFESVVVTVNALRATPVLGLKIHSNSISGLNAQQIISVAKNELATPLRLRFQNKEFIIYPSDVGAVLDNKELIKRSYTLGKIGTWRNKLYDQTLSFLGKKHIDLPGGISKTLLIVKILDIEGMVNEPSKPAMPNFVGDLNETISAKTGIKVNAKELGDLIEKNIFNPPTLTLELPFQSIPPSQHPNMDLISIRNQALELVQKPISISSGGEVFTLSVDDIKRLLTVVERPDVKNPNISTLQLRLDEKRLNQKLGEFAVRVESKTNAEFDDHDARVAIYSQFFSGKRKLLEIPTGFNETNIVLFDKSHKAEQLSLQIKPGSVLAAATIQSSDSNFSSSTQVSKPIQQNKNVYITFDDGPNAVYHPIILDILKKYKIPATFFLVGENAKRFPEMTNRTIDEGYTIGNHSLTHAFLPKLTHQQIDQEIKTASEILQTFTNKPIALFRPPYGGVNQYIRQDAKTYSLKLVLWDVDPRDWSEPDTQTLIDRVISHVHNGSDVLMHSNHLVTIKALPKIIETLQSEGYSFLTL